MGNFTVRDVEPIRYDFTGYQKVDGSGLCSGKGVVAEPSDEQIEAFQTQLDLLTDGQTYSQGREVMTDLLASVNVDRSHVEELPPRVFDAFALFVIQELLPKGLSGSPY